MKIAVIVARILLGLLFLFSGLNVLLHFFTPAPMPPSDSATFANLLMASKYMTFVAVLMVIGSLLLLVGKYVPLGLTLLGPIIVNILLFHFTLMHGGAAAGLVAAVFEIFLVVAYRRSFRGIFDADPPPSTTI
jgi:putative oxidoreductase